MTDLNATHNADALGRGTLYLVPAPLDFGCANQTPLQEVIPAGTLHTTSQIQYWICENAKSNRAYLKRVDAISPLRVSLQAMNMQELPHQVHKKGDHLGNFDARHLLQPALDGHVMGLVSEAGMPAIADPGSSVVRAAHLLSIPVVPLVGPVSLMLALAASGLNGQNFAFVGYLPQAPDERHRHIRELDALAQKTGQTQLFIETPYRNTVVLQTLLQALQPHSRLATASNLTNSSANCHSATVKEWKTKPWALDNNVPTVFAIGR